MQYNDVSNAWHYRVVHEDLASSQIQGYRDIGKNC